MLRRLRKKPEATEFEGDESKDVSLGQYRTLYFYNNDWAGRSARILDEDNNSTLYEIDIRIRRPNMIFRRSASGGDTVGTIKFNPWNRAITAEFNNNTISIKSKNWKCVDLPYTSPAFGGRTLTWNRKTPWVVLDHVLMDENMLPIARIHPRSCSAKKPGTIELVDRDLGQDAIDEIVLTGMAVLQNTIYYTSANAGAAAA